MKHLTNKITNRAWKMRVSGFILFLLFSLSVLAQNVPPRPSPPRLVNDFAGMLSATEQATLENKLVKYDDTTSNQIAIVTLSSLGNDNIDQLAFAIID